MSTNELTRELELAILIELRTEARAQIRHIHDPLFGEDEQPVTALGRVLAALDREIAKASAEKSDDADRKRGRS